MTRTFNFKIVWFSLGALLVIEALFMFLTLGISFLYGESDFMAILYAALITLGVGVLGLLVGRRNDKRLGKREGYIIVASVWVVFSLFGMLPYYFSGAIPHYTNAFFESISGFTTTAASVVEDVESLSHGMLFWRSLTNWLGGMGIIVLSLAIFPFLGVGGMSLFTAEVTGATYEKIRPKMKDTAKYLWGMYLLLTVAEAVLLRVCGMGWFDAVCHSFTTISTGGFSTKNAGVAAYGAGVHYVVLLFMIVGGINFTLLYFLFKGKLNRLREDEELKWYVNAIVLFSFIATVVLIVFSDTQNWRMWEASFRQATFNVVALITTTGFAGFDYTLWPSILPLLMFLLYFTGGSAGSTSGGIKWSRIALLCKNVLCEYKRRIHPNAIIPVRLNGKVINSGVANGITAFIAIYLGLIMVGTVVCVLSGLSPTEALGAVTASIGNVGPGLGASGPAGNYAMMPEIVKWILAVYMLLGRLELFTVMLIFTPAFWRK